MSYGVCPVFPSNPTRMASIASVATTGGPITLFTIATGRILLRTLTARVTTALGANATTLSFNTNPTTGSDTSLSGASADVQSAAIGSKLAITGVPGDATVYVATGGAIKGETTPLIVDIGTIELVVNSGGDGTGRLTVYAEWSPIDAGATLA